MIYLSNILKILLSKLEQIRPNLKLRQNWNLLLNPMLARVVSKNPDLVAKLKSKLPKLPKSLVFTRGLAINPVWKKTPISKDIGEPHREFSISLDRMFGFINFSSILRRFIHD